MPYPTLAFVIVVARTYSRWMYRPIVCCNLSRSPLLQSPSIAVYCHHICHRYLPLPFVYYSHQHRQPLVVLSICFCLLHRSFSYHIVRCWRKFFRFIHYATTLSSNIYLYFAATSDLYFFSIIHFSLAALCHHPPLSPRSPLHALRDILVVVLSRVSYLPQLFTFLASSYSAQLLISAAIASSVSFSAVAFALVPLLAVSSAAVPMSYTFPPDDVAHASISV